MEDFIQIKEKNVLNFGIKDKEGNDTGLVIKFDLQDVELPLRLNKMEGIHKKNQSILRQQAIALEKQEDKKGKFMLSWKEEQRQKLLQEYYNKDMKAMDLLIGEGMTKKILNAIGRNPYYNMYDDILDALNPILDKINKEADNMYNDLEPIFNEIKKKYDTDENNVI